MERLDSVLAAHPFFRGLPQQHIQLISGCDYRDCEKMGTVRLISMDGSDCGVLCWRHGEELVSPGDKLIVLQQVSGRRKGDAR